MTFSAAYTIIQYNNTMYNARIRYTLYDNTPQCLLIDRRHKVWYLRWIDVLIYTVVRSNLYYLKTRHAGKLEKNAFVQEVDEQILNATTFPHMVREVNH